MSFHIEFRPKAYRFLKKLNDKKLQSRLISAIEKLEENPHPPGSIILSGTTNQYRIRVGDYRILYSLEEEILLVLILVIGHRREVYRG